MKRSFLVEVDSIDTGSVLKQKSYAILVAVLGDVVERGHPVPGLPLVQVGLDLDDQSFKAADLAQLSSLKSSSPITFKGDQKARLSTS